VKLGVLEAQQQKPEQIERKQGQEQNLRGPLEGDDRQCSQEKTYVEGKKD
jgi:hypothetical protein